MRYFLFNTFMLILQKMGKKIFTIFTWFVTAGHFFLSPSRVLISVNFYRAIFPEQGALHHIRNTWKQYHNFSDLYIQRFFNRDYHAISYDSEGWEYIEEAKKNGTGGILLMSHVGNWEIAASLLQNKGLKLLLYMGEKNKELLEKNQKENLKKNGVQIIAVKENSENPFNIIDGVNFLKKGGLISMTGDRLWGKSARSIEVNFLGYKVNLPESPHIIALLSGAPLFVFFAFKTGKDRFHFQISKPIHVTASSRKERMKILEQSAQNYADILGQVVKEHPARWYHFEPFLGEKLGEKIKE